MDDVWERSVPLYMVPKPELDNIFYDFNKSIVHKFEIIAIGCRNSNYLVETSSGRYLLRICPVNDAGYKNEIAVFEALYGLINIPELLSIVKLNKNTCLIYEYIEAVSMQELFANKQGVDDYIISQVATTAATIHNLKKGDILGLNELDLPPFSTWYDLFIDNKRAVQRLGFDTVKRIKKLVSDYDQLIQQIDFYKSFIHCDFIPANMLIDKNNKVFFVDWEYACFGHTLADIGQFFRYNQCFSKKQICIFEEEYNNAANVKIPINRYDLSKLRDLVNPLQMIGAKEELPNKYWDLKNIITNTLEYFKC